MSNNIYVRLLNNDDIDAIVRLLDTSDYIYQRFSYHELPLMLLHYPGVGLFYKNSLCGILLSQNINTLSSWIGGFGVGWEESDSYVEILNILLERLLPHLARRGVRHLHYSGNDSARDWLRPILLDEGFFPYRDLFSYDKFEYSIPSWGNQEITIRPFERERDIDTLIAIDKLCFEDLWQYGNTIFNDVSETHPYFAVAELDGQVIGYQFNAVDGESGYLVRIAVHPSVNQRGIGARLLAEGVHFFEQARVTRIMLNTQQTNYRAHRLYEWFNFVRLDQQGFTLRKIF